jgi:hypothetical protein
MRAHLTGKCRKIKVEAGRTAQQSVGSGKCPNMLLVERRPAVRLSGWKPNVSFFPTRQRRPLILPEQSFREGLTSEQNMNIEF